ncbi:hypothetical protein E2C01_009129 [Portunus trituberculatus]|uniref:Uncharacterized protein n=1 Tax=Portunus trituberculatus TaxID=210409 RepID=A0A5B7D431_PORTR|nr:hypothetical protein [Portunus trituberculatus]
MVSHSTREGSTVILHSAVLWGSSPATRTPELLSSSVSIVSTWENSDSYLANTACPGPEAHPPTPPSLHSSDRKATLRGQTSGVEERLSG